MTRKSAPPRKKPTASPARRPAVRVKTQKPPARHATYQNPKRRKVRNGGDGGSWLPTKRAVLLTLLRMMLACFIIGGMVVMYFAQDLPDIGRIDTIRKQQGITMEAADGRAIANYGDVYGEYIPYDQLPKSLIQAVLATEDRRFFDHHGIDVFGIFRALVTNLTHGELRQGGSTVTQQVAKNVFLTPERSISRKIQEVLLAFWLEGRFSKKEIMAIYLNRVYLGAGTFGVDAASHRYFNKSARDLDLEESALLAGLLKAPSRYSPAASKARARERTHQVLVNMEDAGFITKKDVTKALAHYDVSPTRKSESGGEVRYFTDWVLDEIQPLVGQVEEDLIVTTTFDAEMQKYAVDTLQNVIATEGPEKHISQGALVAMEPDGAVRAMVGGLSYKDSQYNRAAQAKRQPGSVFKLFVYLAAVEAGLTPQSMVMDAPITLQVGNKTWTPDNYSNGEYRGEIPMVEALRNSLNTVSVRLSQYTGVRRVAAMAMRLGIPNVPERPSIALGSVEATLLEMTGAYAHLANNGNNVVPYGILSIRNRDGKELYKRTETSPTPLLAKGTVEMMNYMLLDVVRRGTAVKAGLAGRDVAGKTGTSQDFKDAWFIGFTPQMVTGVWIGNDDNKPMKKVTGGSVPATIFHDFMTLAMQGKPVRSIPSNSSSGEGLFPWLFGGDSTDAPSEEPNPLVPVTNPSAIPQDSPFGFTNPERAPQRPAPAPAVAPAPQSAAPAAPPRPAPEGNDVLTPQFWNKLADKVPGDNKVEYNYPGAAR